MTSDAHHLATRVRLLVLFGGQSAEHDVSCVSSRHVLAAADPARYDVQAIGITRDGSAVHALDAEAAWRSGALPDFLVPEGPEVELAAVVREAKARARAHTQPQAVVVVPLLHGPMGEDGTVQGLLELLDVAYVGSGVLGSSVCMDKAMAKVVTEQAGIPQCRHVSLLEPAADLDTARSLVAQLGLPLFVKPANLGSSVGVSRATDLDEVVTALEVARSYDAWVVVEEAVVGREIECSVLGNEGHARASLPGEIRPKAAFYDYEEKYVSDSAELLVPAPLPDDVAAEVQRLSLAAYAALRCAGMARVDFFYEEDGRGLLLNEVNTIPGFTPISMYPRMWAATGLAYPALVDALVELALDRHASRRRNVAR